MGNDWRVKTLSTNETEELDRISHNLAAMAGSKTTTTRPVAKALLLRGWYFCQGEAREPIARHVGLGVYEISSRVKP